MRGADVFAPGFMVPWSSIESHPEFAKRRVEVVDVQVGAGNLQ
jgi:hypothetical protein